MAIPSNTFDTYAAIGIREDLSDMIANISPTQTPFITSCKKGTCSNRLTEWQTDALASTDTANAVIEGDDATLDAVTPTVRLNNYTQISDKTAVISGTEESVKKAGRAREMAYQIAKKTKELKRDMEAIALMNQAKAAGTTGATARKLGSVLSWIGTNDDFGAGAGASPVGADGSATRTDGTQRAFTESQLKTVLQGCYTEGGDPTVIMCGAFNKQVASTFTGGATKFDKSEDSTLYAAFDVYKSDFGTLKIVPNRFMRTRDCLVLDMDYWELAYLRAPRTWPLAKTGDTEKNQILVEWTIKSLQEKASGGVFDLTTS
ncbi:DUF5309 domain-containing protein [Sphingomonas sp.]|jgi:hypothetical protein|uniref:DUF5309 domain-containing protein n=1 Tax=Sphingomonas sp. TaxID=28214 RepID=UPI0035695021